MSKHHAEVFQAQDGSWYWSCPCGATGTPTDDQQKVQTDAEKHNGS